MASTIWRGYTLYERAASSGVTPDENIESERTGCTRTYDIDWSSPNVLSPVAQRQQIVKNILGYPVILPAPGGGAKFISRVTPHFSYNWKRTTDAEPFLYATKVRTQGLGPCPNAATYQNLGGKRDGTHVDPIYSKNRLTVTYETLPFEIKDDAEVAYQPNGYADESRWERYIQKIVKPAGEFFTIPAGSMKQVGGASTGTLIEIGTAKFLSFYNLQVTWFQVPEAAVPCKAINSTFTEANCIEGMLGRVNSVAFNGYSQGQLLLLAAELKPYRSPFGDRLYEVVYFFKFFRGIPAWAVDATGVTGIGHLGIYRPRDNSGALGVGVGPGYYEITTTGATNLVAMADGKSIYDFADFHKLFRHGT